MTRGSSSGATGAALCLACSIILAGFLSRVCAAQAQPQAGAARLDSIEITGSLRFGAQQIVAATGLHVGAQVTHEDLQKVANDLAQLGPFSNVEYRYSSTDDSVRAEYQVTDAPEVPIGFDNFPWFTDDELKAAIKSSVVLFDGAAPRHGTLLDAMSGAIEKLLVTRGVNAGVSHALVAAPASDGQIQQFRVENFDMKITSIEFSDALAQSDRAVQARLGDLIGEPFSRTAIELFEVEQLRPVYISHAFLRVRFGPPTARVAGTSITVIAPIEPGSAFAWDGVKWSGNSVMSMLELGALVPLHEGDPADGMKVESGWQAVREAYMRRGYLDVALNPTAQFDDAAKRVGYSVSVTEGPQYHMGKLVLTGLSIDGERRIRAAWKIPPGAVFDNGIYEEFLSNGITQAFTGLPFHYEKVGRFLQKDSGAATVDVLLDFQ
ncbi:MAG: POTRA domain-containing protein [Candidatus Acidiferrales bacterium]|jgi:outer membrane protein assembly factor BamA